MGAWKRGGRPSRLRGRALECVGDDGVGGTQHRGDQRGEVEVSLGSGPHDTGEYLLGVGAVAGAIAAADLSDDDGGANGLFGAPSWSRRPTGPTGRRTRPRPTAAFPSSTGRLHRGTGA